MNRTLHRLAILGWALLPAGAATGTPAFASGDYTTTTLADATGALCKYNPTIPATDPTCQTPCQFDPELASDDPYCEDPSSTIPPTFPPTTTLAPSTTSVASAPTTTTATSLPATTPTTTSLPTSTAPATSSPSTTTATAPPPVPSTTVGSCDGPQCPRLPVTGREVNVARWAIVIASVGGILVLISSRRRPT